MGDIVKTVDRAEFEKRKKEHLQVRGCPECGFSIEIVMDFPIYGSNSATLRCKNCGHSLKEYLPAEYVTCENSMGFFHSAKSLSRGIVALVEKWNEYAKERYNLNQQMHAEEYRKAAAEERKRTRVFRQFEMESDEVTANA